MTQTTSAGRRGPSLMTEAEYDAARAEHGATYAAWEYASRWLKVWRHLHPDETREDHEIFGSADYPGGIAE